MKNLQEKVKDIVELRDFKRLTDFAADPVKTLSNYHFTDVTAELMSKWIDRIVNLHGQRLPAFALAGYRGVGKSHFLAVLGAMMQHPDLRSRVTEPLVSSAAQRLRRRYYPVAYVRRGLKPTLREELIDALAVSLELPASDLDLPLEDLLGLASDKGGEVPFILIIDTASERESHVSRDDGPFLSEIAETASNKNVFLGIALDDDIAGADGINSAISRSYTIDYLDQEHLYKVVEAHIFPKRTQMQAVLHGVYDHLRRHLPTFRWSEQRFNALYPMHPVILEVAPIVRFYVHDFALLGFAAEAGAKILGRPADSLIGLDEVFDLVEGDLRKVKDLEEAFAAYDKLNKEVVGKLPVMQRLQAKLVLKALLLLSMDGSGKTAGEICAAMLFYDEKNADKALKDIADTVDIFIKAMPEAVQGKLDNSGEMRYGFKLSNKDVLNTALADAAAKCPAEAVPKMLRRMMRERFADCAFADESDSERANWMDCQTTWRGGLRRGRLIWGPIGTDPSAELLDWEAEIVFGGENPNEQTDGDVPKALWKPDELLAEEVDTIKRYHELLLNASLREQFAEQIRTASHSHMVAVEKIWNRVFLLDGKLTVSGKDTAFTEAACGADRLSEIFSIMLKPMCEELYPNHPHFEETLGMNEVSALATDLFSGGGQSSAELQQLAEKFALPLGLVTRRGEIYLPEYEEVLASLTVVSEILSLVDKSAGKNVSLKAIYKRLKQAPYGLSREAQHLVLTALVSRRQIEFVTIKGDRINRRSLDLKIIWGDIESVARPAGKAYTGDKLTHWASALTGKQKFAQKGADGNDEILDAFADWLMDWRERRILEKFNALPDETLNTRIWRLSMHAMNSFGVVAYAINSVLENSMTMDECLHRISDAFSDSKEELNRRCEELIKLEDFIDGASMRQEIRTYLSTCEITRDDQIEALREKLATAIDESYLNPNREYNTAMEKLWTEFRSLFSEHFAISHEIVMRSHSLQEKFDEIVKSDAWWQFENLSRIAVLPTEYWLKANRINREMRQMDCRFEIREMLQIHPFCACSFSLARKEHWETLPQILSETIEQGLCSYRQTLASMSSIVIPMLEELKSKINEEDVSAAVTELTNSLLGSGDAPYSNTQLSLLQKIFEGAGTSDSVIEISPSALSFIDDGREDFSSLVAEFADELIPQQ